jgi:hypothetical protein
MILLFNVFVNQKLKQKRPKLIIINILRIGLSGIIFLLNVSLEPSMERKEL